MLPYAESLLHFNPNCAVAPLCLLSEVPVRKDRGGKSHGAEAGAPSWHVCPSIELNSHKHTAVPVSHDHRSCCLSFTLPQLRVRAETTWINQFFFSIYLFIFYECDGKFFVFFPHFPKRQNKM